MKLLSYLFTLFFAFNALAVAPYGIKGQQQAPTLYSNVHQFPNNQVTNLGGINALVESGNSNILSNPSFEHSTFSTDWTFSGTSSFFEDVTRVLNGKKSSGILAVSQSFALVQDSTLYASQFAGQVQGLAMVRIKANAGATGIKVCSRQAGVTSTTNCVDVVANDQWGLYKVPFILGATSNGISIASTGNTTSVVYIDDAFVGVTDIAQISSAIGPDIAYTPTVTAAIGTITNYSVTGSYRQVGAYAYVSGKITFTGAVGTWTQPKISMPSGLTINTSIQPVGFVKDSSTLIQDIGATEYGEGKNYVIDSSTLAIFSSFRNIAIAVYSDNITQASPFAFASGDIISWSALVPVTQFSGSISTYSTPMLTNADRIGEVIQTTNSTAPQGFISALNKSIGQTGSGATYTGQTYFALYEHLWSIAGLTTTAGDVYRISSAKGASASADFAANKTITVDYETNAPFIRGKASAAGVGDYTADQFQGHWHRFNQTQAPNAGVLVTSSGSEVVPFMRSTGTGNAFVAAANGITDPWDASGYGTARFGTETKPKNVSLFMYIRYTGDSNIIVGSFNGLQSCTSTLACTDTFSGRITGAGNVSNENVDFINGTCSVNGTTGDVTCPFVTGTFNEASGPNCEVTPVMASGVNGTMATISSITSSAIIFKTNRHDAAIVLDTVILMCQKTGADYIGKTAMAVASDQNVRSIGSTNVDIQSVYFGSGASCTSPCTATPCSTCTKIGTKITSVSRDAVGVYRINGIDGLSKYNCSGSNGYNGGIRSGIHVIDASNSASAQMNYYSTGTTLSDVGYTNVTCIGIP